MTRTRIVSLLACALACALPINPQARQASPATAAQPQNEQTLLNSFRWRSIGPDRGGRSIAAQRRQGPAQARATSARRAAASGRPPTAARTWAPVTDGQIHSASVGAVAVSEIESRHRVHRHGRVVHSRQHHGRATASTSPPTPARRGRTSASATSRPSRRSASIRRNPNIVFVAAFGNYSVPNDERGVYKSTDGGKTWQRVLFRDDKTGGDRHRDRPQQPGRHVRRAVGGDAQRVDDVERRPGQRAVQVDRRRRDTGRRSRAIPGCPPGVDRQDRRVGLRRRSEPRVRARSRTRTAGSSARTTPAPRGRWSTPAATSGSARSTTRTSPPTRTTRTSCTCRTSARSGRPTAARPWRATPAATRTTCGSIPTTRST